MKRSVSLSFWRDGFSWHRICVKRCKMCNLNFGTEREALETQVIKKACMDNDHSLDENGCYQCKECDKIFFDKNSLTRHSTGKHDKRLKRKFECTTCKQIFSYASTLKRHCLKFHKKAWGILTFLNTFVIYSFFTVINH